MGGFAPGKRIGIGRQAEVFEWGCGSVLKLFFQEVSEERIRFEALAQQAAFEAGLRVPAVHEITGFGGRLGLVMNRIEGTDALAAIQQQPWRLWTIGRALGKLHHELNAIRAPRELPHLRDKVGRSLTSPFVPWLARERLQRLFETLPDGDRLCHFDFHPGNVIDSRSGPVVIDLAGACCGDPIADYVKSRLVLAVGRSVGKIGMSDRLGFVAGRSALATAYRSGYQSHGRIDMALARKWKPLVVASRLAEGIPEERVALLQLLSRSLREAEPRA